MFRYTCLNPIAQVGLNGFDDTYEKTEALADADAALVRSAKMHEMELPEKLCAIARAGAGVNNIPLEKCADICLECGFSNFGNFLREFRKQTGLTPLKYRRKSRG